MVAEDDVREAEDFQSDLLMIEGCYVCAEVDHPDGLVVGMVLYFVAII